MLRQHCKEIQRVSEPTCPCGVPKLTVTLKKSMFYYGLPVRCCFVCMAIVFRDLIERWRRVHALNRSMLCYLILMVQFELDLQWDFDIYSTE